MAILKAQLLTSVKDALERQDEGNIDSQIRRVLQKVSARGDFLADIKDTDLIDPDIISIDVPDYFKKIKNITLENTVTGYMSPALVQIPFQDYVNAAVRTGLSLPTMFAIDNRVIYFLPQASTEYKVIINYFKYHPNDVDDIEFDDRFLNVLESGSVFEVARKYGLTEQINLWKQSYDEDLRTAMSYSMSPTYFVPFRR